MFKQKSYKRKTIIIAILLVFISYIILSCVMPSKVYAAQTTENYSSSKISKYPGYQALIDNIKSKHPNWKIKILYTGLDWNQVIKNETTASHGRNLVYYTQSGAWVCSTCGNKEYDTGKWRCASEAAVSYYMDPRNWINDDYIFQFESLTFDSSTQNLAGVEKIMNAAAWARGSTITYTKTDGTTGKINKSYSKVVFEAAQEAGISPYHLASRLVLEQGKNSTPGATARGTYSGYVGYYNFCNVNAWGSGTAAVMQNAMSYAKDKGWSDPEASIKGGAKFIAKSYINVGQSTLYLQKYDVDNSDGKLYYHQYMGNVEAAATECKSVKSSYQSLGMLDNSFTFVIPVYENMPDTVCASPDSTSIVTQNVEVTGTNVQVRNAASLIGTVVTKLNTGDKVLRIECAASQVDGYYWDKIVLPNGAKAYIARNFIKQVADITNCNISAVANTSVNLRNGPGTNGTTVITTLISGQAVTIIEKDVYNGLNDFNWVRVKCSNGTQGYIASQYLTEMGEATTTTTTNNSNYKIATIKCDEGSSVRVRSEATTNSSVVTSCKKGTTVTVMKENVATANGYTWDKIVTSEGLEGYVANQYLDKGTTSNTSTGSTTAAGSGDVNGNGGLDASDYVLVKNHIMGKTTLSASQVKVGDMNGNGGLDASDYVLIKKKIMN
ncbi:MAG: SH3 domain-containing protein [Clostridia bacterium]|nr:SH3 domain-containing protein [Clostridia bacterium]